MLTRSLMSSSVIFSGTCIFLAIAKPFAPMAHTIAAGIRKLGAKSPRTFMTIAGHFSAVPIRAHFEATADPASTVSKNALC